MINATSEFDAPINRKADLVYVLLVVKAVREKKPDDWKGLHSVTNWIWLPSKILAIYRGKHYAVEKYFV